MYLFCSSKSLEERQQRKKKIVNGGQEGISENFVAFVRIVGKGTRTI
jgi:hypothetical protein